MRVLVYGSGGREHALGYFTGQDSRVEKLFFLGGNGGTGSIGTNISLQDEKLLPLVQKNDIGLVIIGPEQPLVNGVADELRASKIPVFGPSKKAAKLEGSKAHSKDFMKKYNIPTAQYNSFESKKEAYNFAKKMEHPLVIKASGLAAGKGVIISQSLGETDKVLSEIMEDGRFGEAGSVVVIEEFLVGSELSIHSFLLVDEKKRFYSTMPYSQDNKKSLDGDLGPNTGGMGVVAPLGIDSELERLIKRDVLEATIDGLQDSNAPYQGMLFTGIMVVKNRPLVLEYNVRFGDPETEATLPLLDSSLFQIINSIANGEEPEEILWKKDRCIVDVVLASEGYPAKYSKGIPITNIPKNIRDQLYIFHAGTKKQEGQLLTSGGRVLNVVGVGKDVTTARETAYQYANEIKFSTKYYRKDIGERYAKR